MAARKAASTPKRKPRAKKTPAAPSRAVVALREQVESQRLQLEATKLKRQLALVEAVTDSVMGTPVPYEEIYGGWRGTPWLPIFARELYQSKATTLRYLQQFDRMRNLARYAYETNPNAAAGINGLCAYVIAGGLEVAVTPKDDPHTDANEATEAGPQREAEQAQAILNEFAEVNELSDAADGCPLYDEVFIRCHKEGEVFLRLYPDQDTVEEAMYVEATRCRLVEPDNIRPPHGANWEGPWAFGILTSGDEGGNGIAWDTQTPLAYNVNYPLIDRDEQVAPQFIHHLKVNVNKNQKRGISTLYAIDEDLRGTQKLRYAAREGQKIRECIAYIREHQMADQAAVQSLQDGVVTGYAQRIDQQANQYQVPVQQIEPGQVVDTTPGTQMKDPPLANTGEAMERNVRVGLQAVATRLNAPEWLITGASNDSSFAASLTAESPFLRTIIKQQARQCGFWKRVFRSVLEIAEEQGRLPEGAVDRLHIVVKAMSPQVRNKAEETNRNKMLHDEGVMSLKTWTAEEGQDFDEEQSRLKEERAEGIGVKEVPPQIEQPGEPETESGLRQQLEGNREQYDGYAEAAIAGYAIGLAETNGQATK